MRLKCPTQPVRRPATLRSSSRRSGSVCLAGVNARHQTPREQRTTVAETEKVGKRPVVAESVQRSVQKECPLPKNPKTEQAAHGNSHTLPNVGVLSGCFMITSSCVCLVYHQHLVPHVPGKGNAPRAWIWKAVTTPLWGQGSRPPPQSCAAGIHALEVWHHGRTVQAGRKSGIVPRDECVSVGPTSVCQV